MRRLAMLHVAQWLNNGKSQHLEMAYYLDIELITRGDVDETWTYERYKAMCLARRIAILISQERWDLAQE